jgi:hypothetical protein
VGGAPLDGADDGDDEGAGDRGATKPASSTLFGGERSAEFLGSGGGFVHWRAFRNG